MENTIKSLSKHHFKLNNGYSIPAMALGTYKIFTQEEIDLSVKTAYDCGYRHIDSAVLYKNEAFIGNTLKRYKIPRDEMFLTSKVPPYYMNYTDTKKVINQSLKKFQTNYLDLFLIHWPEVSEVQHRNDVWKALEEAVLEQKVRSIGVSNFLPSHLQSLMDNCRIKPSINQIELHPLYINKETVDFCNKEAIQIQSYTTFARNDPRLMNSPSMKHLCEKYEKTAYQILIRWGIQHGWVMMPKSVHKERITLNIDIDGFELSEEEIKSLDDMNCEHKVAWDPHTVVL
mmetsp:Transcript_34504/g.35822  ORF Transcript_34504/g.35822 Transcript_34504/m.35822 type:complete len:286 (+) Transcript_34504:14-871(+)